MDTISSAKFRKVYAKLTEEVEVTSNGHLIGMYVPYSPSTLAKALHPVHPRVTTTPSGTEITHHHGEGTDVLHEIKFNIPTAQSQRDAILRKINRGG